MTPRAAAGSRPGYREAVAALAGAQKSGAGVPLYTRYINRSMGRHLAALGSVVGATPNQVTLVSAAFSAVGLAVLATVEPGVGSVTLAVALLVLGYALDSADGQLARLTGRGGPAGEWLDHVVDAVRNPAIHLVTLIALYRFGSVDDAALLLPMGFILVTSGRYVGQMLAEQLQRSVDPRATGAAAEPVGSGLTRSFVQLPSDSGMINLVFLLLPASDVFVLVYAALLAANAMLAIASWRRRFGELRRLRPAARGEQP